MGLLGRYGDLWFFLLVSSLGIPGGWTFIVGWYSLMGHVQAGNNM